jgi:hypothetical protein
MVIRGSNPLVSAKSKMLNKEKQLLVGGAALYKLSRGKVYWFLVKQNPDSDWELLKTNVRRGESSVRSIIRFTGEQAMMRTKVLEEAGRTTSVVKLGNKPVTQKTLYYLMVFKEAGEILGISSYQWLEYQKAVKKLALKKEQTILKAARDLQKEIDKKVKK